MSMQGALFLIFASLGVTSSLDTVVGAIDIAPPVKSESKAGAPPVMREEAGPEHAKRVLEKSGVFLPDDVWNRIVNDKSTIYGRDGSANGRVPDGDSMFSSKSVAAAASKQRVEDQREKARVHRSSQSSTESKPVPRRKQAHSSFQIRVAGPSGVVCLTEVREGGGSFSIKGEKCRRNPTQYWYWVGDQLKTERSDKRCLGYMNSAGSNGRPLVMYHCSAAEKDASPYTQWQMDSNGRLKSLSGKQCMAFDEDSDLKAIILPCENDTRAEL
mmetsp:Transcript_37639/g.59509  ORF Transcript_37639/g.59509 Transcript_37639/m.59509 type:complete len:271 (+) Transcript_37639:64-876(+)|eukprot:CAMPEP_0169225532 /NCGR_PEP_ID=MMETSP1016-20121227/23251_1 /TAXON_ID=342587 /ORGANISM="Karlodinium micrum, Strain CCMP2283" /LENGTH=270 /DNA_ID=CAMNT_0009304051 /DNA_START=65 /DNA_END=877 /DNA_ORIENTATION=-